ncbi:hypothetical protein RIF29_38562 [Crotalaria pallida]|uniref:Uncharacterized protein n=1 Tax=Crotalaria pallida TaxID=3830 RepID=A0AAN9HP23_CROPI
MKELHTFSLHPLSRCTLSLFPQNPKRRRRRPSALPPPSVRSLSLPPSQELAASLSLRSHFSSSLPLAARHAPVLPHAPVIKRLSHAVCSPPPSSLLLLISHFQIQFSLPAPKQRPEDIAPQPEY